MLKRLKQLLPKPVKKILIKIKRVTIERYKKKQLIKRMLIKHHKLLQEIEGKEKIRVIFLAIHESVWKVDTVFKRMLHDPYFEPEILVCPYTAYGEKRMIEDIDQAYSYFNNKKYPVTKARQSDGSWVKIEELSPDLIFFTNPHNLTCPEYYEKVYLNYLSCYVPYFFLASTHSDDQGIYNQDFNNVMWKNFMPHDYSMQKAIEVSCDKAKNCLLTGYPSCEDLIDSNRPHKNVWKSQSKAKKKIIYSPHHTIDDSKSSLSSFLEVGEFMLEIAIKYKNDIQWSFKPHPILKSKLYIHSNWGKERTDLYYGFWEKQEYTQLDDGEYDDLFIGSDAIIHDCSSFIVEYAFTGKPCLYLLGDKKLVDLVNDFGMGIMAIYEKARTNQDIEKFITSVLFDEFSTDREKRNFFEEYLNKFYKDSLPSEKIIANIKQSLGKANV